jgi:hypothetical protein
MIYFYNYAIRCAVAITYRIGTYFILIVHINEYIYTCTLISMVNLTLPILNLCGCVVGLCCAVGSWFCFGFAHSCL